MPRFQLYLIRHEEAEPGYDIPDSQRALTGHGRQRMRETGKLVKEQSQIDVIYTSPLVRAVQTAEILAGALGFDEPMLAKDVLANPPSISAIVDLIAASPSGVRGVALVGHEPTMSELAAELLDVSQFPRPFKKGTVLALEFERTKRRAAFRWLILGKGPTLVRDLHE